MARGNFLKKVVDSQENGLFQSPWETLKCVVTAQAVENGRVEADNEARPR